jgi:topoisomerase-4 subunit A
VLADNGRVYTLGGDKLPGGRGFGEPVRLFIDLEAEVEIVALMVVRPDTKLLVASSSDGRGFVTSGEATLAETRKGKQLVNLRPGAKVAVVRGRRPARRRGRGDRREPQDAGVPLDELPELGAGQGVQLQRYRDGGLSDAIAFALATGSAGRWAARAAGCGPKAT